MAKTRIVAGIDIGSSKIATLIAQAPTSPEDEGINIVGVASSPSRGVKKGQIKDIEDAAQSVIDSVEKAERMAGYNIERVFTSIGGGHIQSQNSHGVVAVADPDGEVRPEDVERVIEAASAISVPSSREIIHVLPREFVVDGERGIRDPVGMSGVRLETETHLVTASSTVLKSVRRCVSEVGAGTEDLVFTGISSAEAVLTNTEKELGVVLVDLGGGTTSIVVYIDGALAHSGVLPIGAENVTNDIAIGSRVSLEVAEKIKVALGEKGGKGEKEEEEEIELASLGLEEDKRKISKKTLVEGIIRPRLNEIFTMVGMELRDAGVAGKTPSGVVLSGGGALTAGVQESARRMLSLPVRVAKPTGVSGLIDEIETPEWATVVGLILWGAGRRQERIFSFPGLGRTFESLPGRGFLDRAVSVLRDLLP